MAQLFTNCAADTTPQAIEKSASIARIIYILGYYSKWLTEQTNKSNLLTYRQLVYMNDEATNTNNRKKQSIKQQKINDGIYSWINNLSSTYSLSKILDDFHYILFFHSSNNDITNDDFENLTHYIRNKLIENDKNDTNIDITQSIQLIRNNRCRNKYSQNSNLRVSTYCGYSDSNDVITQQILDSIYCFLLFTFDFGYRLNSKQIAVLDDMDDNQDANDNELFDKKLKYMKDILSTNKLYTQFQHDCDDTKAEQKSDDEKNGNGNGNGNLSIFESGIKYYYWNQNKNENKWYVKPKHDSFKEEIVLFNIYCTLNNDQWNDIVIKSKCLLETNMAKILKASSYFANEYEIENRSAITVQHIISLLLYANFRKLRNCLNETYYATSEYETAEGIINRHSEFCYFGRLLRESVELFGWQSDNSDAPSIYYFGLNKICLFNSSIPYINTPLLTTASINVVLLSKKGQMCSVRPYEQYLRYFDCSWIADNIGKNEKLFIGGHEPFIICSIYNIKLCLNYNKYITSIDYFNNMIKAEPYLCDDDNDINNDTIKIIIDLLNNNKNKNIPSYIKALFECNRMSINNVNINRYLMNTEQFEEDTFGYKAFSNIFINNDKINSPNLNKYIQIFPNLKKITIQNDEHFVNSALDIILSMQLFVSIFEFYKNNHGKTKLKVINVQNANQNQLKLENCKDMFNKIASKYNDTNLKIHIKKETNTISIISA